MMTPLIFMPFSEAAQELYGRVAASQRPAVTAPDDLSGTSARVLLGRVYFLNEGKTRYVSVGFYPSDNYSVLVELGGPRIVPIRLAEQHVRILMDALPALCDACSAVNYTLGRTAPFVYGPAGPLTVLDCITASGVSVSGLQICATWRPCYMWLRHCKVSIYSRRLTSCRTLTAR